MVTQYPVILKGIAATWHFSQKRAQRSCTDAAQREALGFPSEMVPLFQKELRTRKGGKRKRTMRSTILIKNKPSKDPIFLFATYHSEKQVLVRS